MPAESAAQLDLLPYEVKWKTLTLGFCKDVDPTNLRVKTVEKKIGKAGDVVLDRVVIGMEGTIRVVLHQVNKTTIQQLCPWWSSGSVALVPATRYYSQYDNAGELRLHPVGNAGTDEDVVLLKAFPVLVVPKGDGINWREVQTEWNAYPDQTSLLTSNTLAYGYYGNPPA